MIHLGTAEQDIPGIGYSISFQVGYLLKYRYFHWKSKKYCWFYSYSQKGSQFHKNRLQNRFLRSPFPSVNMNGTDKREERMGWRLQKITLNRLIKFDVHNAQLSRYTTLPGSHARKVFQAAHTKLFLPYSSSLLCLYYTKLSSIKNRKAVYRKSNRPLQCRTMKQH